mmetsp:Transcript_17683/g.40576  ORF Transcript_17683/g.40576 Transcript_17683/m.40576 type:complete len:219 (+) Transcript_17683:952-1608(+)
MTHTTEAEIHLPLTTTIKVGEAAPLHLDEVTNHNLLPWDRMDDLSRGMVILNHNNHMGIILITEMHHHEGDLLRRVAEEITGEAAAAADMHHLAVVQGVDHPEAGLSKVGNTVDSITGIAATAICIRITIVVADNLLRDILQGTAAHPILEVLTDTTRPTVTVIQTIEVLSLHTIVVVRHPLREDLLPATPIILVITLRSISNKDRRAREISQSLRER